MEKVLSAVIARLPLTPGVYRFRDAAGQVLYLGRATVLRRRVASYWLDLRPARPGLSVAHEPANRPADIAYFGPYLGGRRARQAVKGLGRVLPLAYTGAGLRGTLLDVARARGLAAADRGHCVETITAVLRREPDAVTGVRARLEELREAAVGALAFELAGDITSEMRALEWVTSPQRASSMAATDFTASGWSGGVLSSFIVRRGQVRQWAQEACPESDAATRLAGTPPDWAGFAQRNAELAAALSSRRGS